MHMDHADTIVVDGKITTMESDGAFVEAMALSHGRIVAIGSTAETSAPLRLMRR